MAGSDIRYAWRALLRQRGATALVVVMLALGIAANVAVFSLVNGLFLRPFPFPQPGSARLHQYRRAEVESRASSASTIRTSIAGRKDQKLFEAITTTRRPTSIVADDNGAERDARRRDHATTSCKCSASSRCSDADSRPKRISRTAPPVVLLSAALWRERFGARSRRRRQDDSSRTAGRGRSSASCRREASFPDDVRLFVPMAGDPARTYESYSGDGIGRMKPGVTAEQADADLKRAHQPIWDTTRQGPRRHAVRQAAARQFVRDYRGAAKTVTGVGRRPAAHRLRERRGGDARARARAAPRDGHPPRARLEPDAADAAAADREPHARRRRRRARAARRTLGDRRAGRARSPTSCRGGRRSTSTPASMAFSVARRRRHRDPVRMGAGAARGRRRPAVRGQRDDQRHDGCAARPADAAVPGRRGVRARGGPARVRHAARESVRSRPQRRSRVSARTACCWRPSRCRRARGRSTSSGRRSGTTSSGARRRFPASMPPV